MGVIEDEEMGGATKQFLILFFYVRKLIARRWIYAETLTLGMCTRLINANLLLYRMIYEACECNKNVRKFGLVGLTSLKLWRLSQMSE